MGEYENSMIFTDEKRIDCDMYKAREKKEKKMLINMHACIHRAMHVVRVLSNNYRAIFYDTDITKINK